MAFANHSNNDYAAGRTDELLLGSFVVAGEGYSHTHEYAQRPSADRDGWAADYPHLVYVNAGSAPQTRVARVLKTVAYVVVDEAADGSPVVEKWEIRGHRQYDTYWATSARRQFEDANA